MKEKKPQSQESHDRFHKERVTSCALHVGAADIRYGSNNMGDALSLLLLGDLSALYLARGLRSSETLRPSPPCIMMR